MWFCERPIWPLELRVPTDWALTLTMSPPVLSVMLLNNPPSTWNASIRADPVSMTSRGLAALGLRMGGFGSGSVRFSGPAVSGAVKKVGAVVVDTGRPAVPVGARAVSVARSWLAAGRVD